MHERGALAWRLDDQDRGTGALSVNVPFTCQIIDALGNLVKFLLLLGQVHDMKGVAPLICGVSFGALLADKAFNANWLLDERDERGAAAVIPPKSNRLVQREYDVEAYCWRHLVENYFAKI